MIKSIVPTVLLVTLLGAQAQTSPAPVAASGKKDLIARILKLQQPGIESMARGLAEQPAVEMLNRAGPLLQTRVPAERRETVAREIQIDARKYVDEVVPLVQGRAIRLAPTTVGALLEEKLTEDELREVVAIVESPVYVKFQQLGGDMQKVLADKLLADTRATVEPKVKALEQTISRRLGLPATPSAAPSPAPARPASR